MSFWHWILLAIFAGFLLMFWMIRIKLLGKHMLPQLAIVRSLKTKKWPWVLGLVAIVIGLIIWQWDTLVALHTSVVGPNFPMWGYAVGITIIIAIIWYAKSNKGGSFEFPFGKIMMLVVVFFLGWYVYDEVNDDCPVKPAYISVPAQGMVIDLPACWDQEFVQVDLREVGATKLSFNAPSKVLEGRTIREFAYLVTGVPGMAHGHARLVFNSSEMRKYGVTTLPVFVGPARTESRVDVEGLAKLAQ